MILTTQACRRYLERFSADDEELYPQHVPNCAATDFLVGNIPILDCPCPELELTYYFRWWTFRKHIRQTTDGFVITEFLPEVSWAGKHNTINLAVGHHLMEGRWFGEQRYLVDAVRFWLRHGGTISGPRAYTSWLAHGIVAQALVAGDRSLACEVLDDLVTNYRAWETGWPVRLWPGSQTGQSGRHPNGLFLQSDDRDGCEFSISGSGYRHLTNAVMFGEAQAIATIADWAVRAPLAVEFRDKARQLKAAVLGILWDPTKRFFMTVGADGTTRTDVRELYGYAPWYFDLPDAGYEDAWRELAEPAGFQAPFGLPFAEQRHPAFRLAYEGHECLWDGPSWPCATALTLTAAANVLNGPDQTVLDKQTYFEALLTYARSQRRVRDDGRVVPWIDENLNPYTGDWIARTRLQNGMWDERKGGKERGKDYNHSTFCDLVITGLLGVRPCRDDAVVVNPLLPDNAWDYFGLDNLPYHGHRLTVLWDKTGARYGRGAGFRVYVDGVAAASAGQLTRLRVDLPPTV